MNWVQFSSICSEIELTQISVFDVVRLPNSIEPNPWIEFDLLCRADVSENVYFQNIQVKEVGFSFAQK